MSPLITKLSKFTTLPYADRRTLVLALLTLPFFWVGLHILGLQRFQVWLNLGRMPTAGTLAPADIQNIARLVNCAAAQAFIPATCLTRSLLLGWLLQRQGVDSQLRIGVRLAKGTLDAHAWVEVAGLIINDQVENVKQYAAFPEILPLNAFQPL